MKTNRLLLANSLGLAAGIGLTLLCLWLNDPWIPTLLPGLIWVIGSLVIFGGTAMLELPLMIYILRNMAANEKDAVRHLALLTSGAFVFFAAVYAVPNLLLADQTQLWAGLLISSTCFLRFACAQFFLKDLL